MSAATASVLTVEDNPITRTELALVLEEAGYTVSAARDGIEAVELARIHRPDVVVMDLSLPRLDGVTAIDRIRAERDIPVVALTGYREGGLVDAAVAAGATSVVMKPYAEAAIVGAVKAALNGDSVGELTDPARRASLEAIRELLGLTGQPVEWAETLELRAFAAGKVWRRV